MNLLPLIAGLLMSPETEPRVIRDTSPRKTKARARSRRRNRLARKSRKRNA